MRDYCKKYVSIMNLLETEKVSLVPQASMAECLGITQCDDTVSL